MTIKKRITVGNITTYKKFLLEQAGYEVTVHVSGGGATDTLRSGFKAELKAARDKVKAEALAAWVPEPKVVYELAEKEHICTRDHVKHDVSDDSKKEGTSNE